MTIYKCSPSYPQLGIIVRGTHRTGSALGTSWLGVGLGWWDEDLGAQPTVVSCPEDPAVRGRLTECLETILNKAQEPPKSKKVQHSNAKNAVLFEAISLIIHHDR